jgi:phage baseplate assembly protein W
VRPPQPVAPPAFPLALDARGRTAVPATARAHAEQLIEELLLTTPGERLNRPTLGSGLMRLVFEQDSAELRAATQFQIAAQLQQWLAGTITVVGVEVSGSDATSEIDVTVSFRLPGAADVQTVTLSR